MVGDLQQAKAAMIMLHGRGATAESILALAAEFDQPQFVYLAPQAAQFTWYPNRFMAPIASNEPWLSSALSTVNEAIDRVQATGIPVERTVLLGFSQGACLALEYAARNPRAYGGVIGLSGGLIGPDDLIREVLGSFTGTPVFLGCGEVDFHIPKERVQHAGNFFKERGAQVTVRFYPNMDHTVNQDEIEFVRSLMVRLLSQ